MSPYHDPVAKSTPAGTPALAALAEAGVAFDLHPYDIVDEAETYGESVASALGIEPERLFKTLLASVDGRPVVAIVPVSSRLSLRKLARLAAAKSGEMIGPADAERLTGYVVGGISPFGQRRRLPVFVDDTIGLFERVFVSAGRRGLQLEVAGAAMVSLLDAAVGDLTD